MGPFRDFRSLSKWTIWHTLYNKENIVNTGKTLANKICPNVIVLVQKHITCSFHRLKDFLAWAVCCPISEHVMILLRFLASIFSNSRVYVNITWPEMGSLPDLERIIFYNFSSENVCCSKRNA